MRDIEKGSTRREFLAAGAALGAVALARHGRAEVIEKAASRPSDQSSPSRRVVVGIMGISQKSGGGMARGTDLAHALLAIPGVDIAYVCDVDQRNVSHAIETVSKKLEKGSAPPKGVKDFRRILDDRSVDALAIAAPDHWHAPAAILACAAGKHVYVEKPCSHNAREGELLVEAAQKYRRLVQHGTQRRSWPAIREAVERLRAGDIGRVISASSYYWSARPTIGRGRQTDVPGWLDWNLWQGPAPRRAFHDNIVHYKWHCFWHWGTGECGNNGVHMIDLARWGLGIDYPNVVSCTGGKYRFSEDDQQTPDTSVVTFNFGDKLMTWENRSWAARTPMEADYDVLFAGEKGFLAIRGSGYAILDHKGKPLARGSGDGGDVSHMRNFIDAIRDGAPLNAPIDQGARSALLCHLGNISFRTSRTVHLDPQTHRISNDSEAAAMWGRQYEAGWEPRA